MPRKAKKKAEAADTAVAMPAAKPASDESELQATSEAGLDRQLDREADERMQAVSPAASSGQVEQLAEAADTFEQAYDDVIAPEHPNPVPSDPDAPEPASIVAGQHDEPEKEPHEEKAREESAKNQPPPRLERLQKILSQAGIASRRHAEEIITEGRVQVNGKVVTELGSKADPARDHIRVDGKLIHGAERLRYFVLNKPKGYVTTVSDPEGRPTVMQFFQKMSERLYPVGRLDYLSEGLLLVTNDGDLANKLTKAATGVEKTYLVKVSGQPTEEELDRLREGVAIDRGRPGDGRVHTGGAVIREARSGDNPWYEVVLTEGRNRELRKMFEEIGHHVEKIRRVGYGPLVLDVEPGHFRELDPDELAKLRLAAEGKWRKPKPKAPEQRKPAPRRERDSAPVRENRRQTRGFRDRGRESQGREQRKDFGRPRFERPAEKRDESSRRPPTGGQATGRGFGRRDEAPRYQGAGKPRERKPGQRARTWNREGAAPPRESRPVPGGGRPPRQDDRSRPGRPRTEPAEGERGRTRSSFARPARPGAGQRQEGNRPWQPRRERPQFGQDGFPASRNERSGGGGSQRGSGPSRSARPPGRSASGPPRGSAKPPGRRPPERGSKNRGDRGKRR